MASPQVMLGPSVRKASLSVAASGIALQSAVSGIGMASRGKFMTVFRLELGVLVPRRKERSL